MRKNWWVSIYLTRHWLRGERTSHHDHIFVTTAFDLSLLTISYTIPYQILLVMLELHKEIL
jgi:hypothetical protein